MDEFLVAGVSPAQRWLRAHPAEGRNPVRGTSGKPPPRCYQIQATVMSKTFLLIFPKVLVHFS